MSEKLGSGIVADGPDRYSEGVDRRWAEIQRQLLDPKVSKEVRFQLKRELEELEQEYKRRKDTIKYSLF